MVGDELEQRAIGVAEVDARAIASCALAPYGPKLDGDAMRLQLRLSPCDGFGPLETKIAVSWLNGELRHRYGIESGPVTVKCVSPKR
jgi:hypothetical protein